MSILLLDHDGLGTYNLAQYLGELGYETEVYHQGQLTLNDISELHPSHIVVSPSAAALAETTTIIQHYGATIPILGVGLGFIAVIQALQGRTECISTICAGQTLAIHHAGLGLLRGLPSPFTGVIDTCHQVRRDNLPKTLDITAWHQTPEGNLDIILAVKHQTWPLQATLFHPEAMLSEHGHAMLTSFLRQGS